MLVKTSELEFRLLIHKNRITMNYLPDKCICVCTLYTYICIYNYKYKNIKSEYI